MNNDTNLVSDVNYDFVSTDFDVTLKKLSLTSTGIGKSDSSFAQTTTTSGSKTYIIFTLPDT